jgi:hypothetical protein
LSGTKIAWLLDNVAGLRRRAEAGEIAFGTVDSWLVHRLTGGQVHATDATNASRTLLMDLDRVEWDHELCILLVTQDPGDRDLESDELVGVGLAVDVRAGLSPRCSPRAASPPERSRIPTGRDRSCCSTLATSRTPGSES